jgi:hypothetical protein
MLSGYPLYRRARIIRREYGTIATNASGREAQEIYASIDYVAYEVLRGVKSTYNSQLRVICLPRSNDTMNKRNRDPTPFSYLASKLSYRSMVIICLKSYTAHAARNAPLHTSYELNCRISSSLCSVRNCWFIGLCISHPRGCPSLA